MKNELMADSDVKPKTNRLPIPLHSHPNLRQSGLAEAEADASSRMLFCARTNQTPLLLIAGHCHPAHVKEDDVDFWHDALWHGDSHEVAMETKEMMIFVGSMPFDMTRAITWPWKRRR